eukprot:1161220-Pelagomonas_calceolata.AAC.4
MCLSLVPRITRQAFYGQLWYQASAFPLNCLGRRLKRCNLTCTCKHQALPMDVQLNNLWNHRKGAAVKWTLESSLGFGGRKWPQGHFPSTPACALAHE